jgi:hypothetical protein
MTTSTPPLSEKGDPPGPMTVEASLTFDLEAGKAADGEAPRLARFEMVANTGNPMRAGGWKFPVVMDFAGTTTRGRASATPSRSPSRTASSWRRASSAATPRPPATC